MDVWMRGGREREGEEREGEERERRGRGEGEERGRGREAGRQRKIRCEARVWEIRLTGPPNRLMWYGGVPPRRRQHPRRRLALRRRATPRRIPVCTTGLHRRRGIHPARARSALRPARRALAGVPAKDIPSRRAGQEAPAFGTPRNSHTHTRRGPEYARDDRLRQAGPDDGLPPRGLRRPGLRGVERAARAGSTCGCEGGGRCPWRCARRVGMMGNGCSDNGDLQRGAWSPEFRNLQRSSATSPRRSGKNSFRFRTLSQCGALVAGRRT